MKRKPGPLVTLSSFHVDGYTPPFSNLLIVSENVWLFLRMLHSLAVLQRYMLA